MNSFFSCKCQYENLGDLIINKMLVDELCRYGSVYIDTGGAPGNFSSFLLQNPRAIDITSERGEDKQRSIRGKLALLIFLWQHNVKIFTDSPGPTFDGRTMSRKTLFKIRMKSLLFGLVGTKIVAVGKCCSNLIHTHADFKSIWADSYYMRSRESVEFIAEHTSSRIVKFIPDLCFLLKYQISPLSKKNVAVFDLRMTDANNILLEWCKKLVKDMISQSFEVIIYYQVEHDLEAVKLLYSYLSGLGVKLREKMVWMDELSFYADKMFVVSNRLHSLLIGAAYGSFPICLYQESTKTLKLKHVLNSSFSPSLPIIYENGAIPEINYKNLYLTYRKQMVEEYGQNAKLCREIISHIEEYAHKRCKDKE